VEVGKSESAGPTKKLVTGTGIPNSVECLRHRFSFGQALVVKLKHRTHNRPAAHTKFHSFIVRARQGHRFSNSFVLRIVESKSIWLVGGTFSGLLIMHHDHRTELDVIGVLFLGPMLLPLACLACRFCRHQEIVR